MIQRTGNPWHDIKCSLDKKKLEFNVIIEIPVNSKNKYELDLRSGYLKCDRVLNTSMHYPANYGFIPQTLGQDADPLDVLVLGLEGIHPMTIVRVRAIAGFRLKDDHGIDDKIVCVNVTDPAYRDYKDSKALPKHTISQIMNFFEQYKVLEGKTSEVGNLFSPKVAANIIEEGVERYKVTEPWTEKWLDENHK